jgi:hypothetical protein
MIFFMYQMLITFFLNRNANWLSSLLLSSISLSFQQLVITDASMCALNFLISSIGPLVDFLVGLYRLEPATLLIVIS